MLSWAQLSATPPPPPHTHTLLTSRQVHFPLPQSGYTSLFITQSNGRHDFDQVTVLHYSVGSIYRSSQCSTTGVTKAVVCVIKYVGI